MFTFPENISSCGYVTASSRRCTARELMKSLLRVVFHLDPESLPTPRSESDLVVVPRTALYNRLNKRPWVNSENWVDVIKHLEGNS